MKTNANLAIKKIIKSFISSDIEAVTYKCPKCKRNIHMRNFRKGRLSTGWCETSYCVTFSENWNEMDKAG